MPCGRRVIAATGCQLHKTIALIETDCPAVAWAHLQEELLKALGSELSNELIQHPLAKTPPLTGRRNGEVKQMGLVNNWHPDQVTHHRTLIHQLEAVVASSQGLIKIHRCPWMGIGLMLDDHDRCNIAAQEWL